MNRWLRYLTLAVVACGLMACSKKTPDSGLYTAGSGDDQGAQTYGAAGQPGFNGQVQHNQYGQVINPLTAPSNQVYYFGYDDNTVNTDDYKAIQIQANYLTDHPSAKVRLEGNTDSRGSREYNIGLGWRRDQAVAHLLEQQGVKPSQIEMVSYGKERPVADGDDESAWRLNRRVELVYEST